ncbi:cytochrome-c peroxidase [Agaribacter flavus]|uniref:Cytochrome-c peroxidase n=1 Tax=Agaribacter flavus TaxID=1902781 RepID=A0ABV7FQB5_9ALTE
MSETAKQGFRLFTGKAKCINCHTGWNFTDQAFHDIGLPGSDLGRGALTQNEQDNFAFKTPSLRNIAQRAPYMHDGRFNTLRDAIVSYISGAKNDRPSLSPEMQVIALSSEEIEAIERFLESLTSEDKEITLPLLPF